MKYVVHLGTLIVFTIGVYACYWCETQTQIIPSKEYPDNPFDFSVEVPKKELIMTPTWLPLPKLISRTTLKYAAGWITGVMILILLMARLDTVKYNE